MRTSFVGISAAQPLRSTQARRARAGLLFLLACATYQGMGVAWAQQTTFTKLADTNTAIPGGGAFTGFNNASISGGNVVFQGSFSGGDGIYSVATSTGTLARIADTTTVPAGHSATFTDVSQPVISGGNVSFSGSYLSNGFGVGGIYTGSVGVTGATTVAEYGQYASGTSGGTFNFFQNGSRISGNSVVYYAQSTDNNRGVYLGAVGTTAHSTVADFNTTAPGQTTKFTSLSGGMAVSGGNIVFRGSYRDSDLATRTGVFASTANGLQVVANNGTVAPGATNGGTLTNFGGPALSGNNAVFRASYTGDNGTVLGVFRFTLGATTGSLVADTMTAAPGHGGTSPGTFNDFDVNSISVSGTSVAFKATLDSNVTGIFLQQNGTLLDVINVNDSLFGSTVSSLNLQTQALDEGSLVFTYGLADGRFGVAGYGLGMVVPEPSTWIAVVTGAGLLGLVRRRRACAV